MLRRRFCASDDRRGTGLGEVRDVAWVRKEHLID
jgi:hypothetical protein